MSIYSLFYIIYIVLFGYSTFGVDFNQSYPKLNYKEKVYKEVSVYLISKILMFDKKNNNVQLQKYK